MRLLRRGPVNRDSVRYTNRLVAESVRLLVGRPPLLAHEHGCCTVVFDSAANQPFRPRHLLVKRNELVAVPDPHLVLHRQERVPESERPEDLVQIGRERGLRKGRADFEEYRRRVAILVSGRVDVDPAFAAAQRVRRVELTGGVVEPTRTQDGARPPEVLPESLDDLGKRARVERGEWASLEFPLRRITHATTIRTPLP